MSQWQPDPRQQPQPQYPPQQYGPPPGYYPQQQWQQPPYPQGAYTRQGLGPFWTLFHLGATLCTGGLWIPFWVWHSRSRNRRTYYR